MAKNGRKYKRDSIIDFDDEDSSIRYHKKYLKLVAITIALTIIGITLFTHSTEIKHYNEPAAGIETFHQWKNIDSPQKSASKKAGQIYNGFQRQLMTAGYFKQSKEIELRQHLKEFQKLFSELKYHR